MNRRKFIKDSAVVIGAGTLLSRCTTSNKIKIKGGIVGANSAVGHLLRNAEWDDMAQKISTGTVIIGGGISGLSAARWLQKEGATDFVLLELDKETGGNSIAGKNDSSAFPWGAHYVPLPNKDLPEYISFLQEADVITGFDRNGLPFINDYYLCFDPQERLYINGFWQEGTIPDFGVPVAEKTEIKNFMAAMQHYRQLKGNDGKDAFSIPVNSSSTDETYRALDKIGMKQWMQQQGYNSSFLHWYVNYCCRDDFGTEYDQTSAWAGIHYFASRKGAAANAAPQSVITWPEGNSWLAKQLRKDTGNNIYKNSPALKVRIQNEKVEVLVLDTITQRRKIIQADKCIVACPQFVAAHLLNYEDAKMKLIMDHFVYQPWMIANLTVSNLKERRGAGLSWDNVFYKGRGLGYVEATHQNTNQINNKKVLTYYCPLTGGTAAAERHMAFKKQFNDWVEIVITDLESAHESLVSSIEEMSVWVWGHGMISPQPGFIHGDVRKKMQEPIANRIFFAHTDLSGISIFEEAFYQGINAAKAVLSKI